MYLFLTSNIFIEKFTHVWAIFFMEMSRCKRENRATYLFTEFDGFVLIFTFFLISFDFSVVFFQMDKFNAFGNYIFYEFNVIHYS